jgi:DNA invertase Pin-like site-specific DNA recombinase
MAADSELVFRVFGAIAHFERRSIAERTKDGIRGLRPRKRLGWQPLDTDRITAALKLISA